MTNETTFIIKPPIPPIIQVHGTDGRALLAIYPNGTVEGDIEDASEAARVFVEHIRRLTTLPTQSGALREALEAAPLIGRTESVFDFMERQEAWLKGPYRAAMQEQSK